MRARRTGAMAITHGPTRSTAPAHRLHVGDVEADRRAQPDLEEVIRIFERVHGHLFEVQHVPADALAAQQAAATDPMMQSFSGLMRCYAAGDTIDMDTTLQDFPVPLTTVEEFAAAGAGVTPVPA